MNILHDTGQVEDETQLQQSQAGLGLGVSITSGSLFPGRVRPCQVMVPHGGPRCRVCYLHYLHYLHYPHYLHYLRFTGYVFITSWELDTMSVRSSQPSVARH